MTDAPAPGRHRNEAGRRRLIGPIVSASSVLLAIGPVVWVMASENPSEAGQRPGVLRTSEGDSGPAVVGEDAGLGADSTLVPPATLTSLPPLLTMGTATLPTGRTSPLVSPSDTVTRIPGKSRTPTTAHPPEPTSSGKKPKPKPSRTVTRPAPPGGGSGTSAQERGVLRLTNAARRQNGCRPLSLDRSLVAAAGLHASDMVRRRYFHHTNPDGKNAVDRMRKAGFGGSTMSENIATGYNSAHLVFDGWMRSKGDRANILNCSYQKIGVGYDPGRIKPEWSSGSWVQDFGRN